MNTIRSVCVYCGSSPGNDVAFVEAGERFGRDLAAASLELIFGGGTNGVMGAVARGVLQSGGKVGAIIPRFLTNRESTTDALAMFDDLTVTETMHERKHKMFERSDAFVALPGGIGTVEEIIEVMTWAQLGQHRKPMVFANIKGFWDPMLAMLDHLQRVGFLHSSHLIRPIASTASSRRSWRLRRPLARLPRAIPPSSTTCSAVWVAGRGAAKISRTTPCTVAGDGRDPAKHLTRRATQG